MTNKTKNSSNEISARVGQISLEDQRQSKEEDIIKNIKRWMSDHTDIIPLGEEDPVMDLLNAFIKSLKTQILALKYSPEAFAAACINLLSGRDTTIKTNPQEIADYFNIDYYKVLWVLAYKICAKFMDFVLDKTCTLFVGGPRRIFLVGTPIEILIAATHTRMKKEVNELLIVDEKRNIVSEVGLGDYYLVKDKRKKVKVTYKNNAKLYEYSPLPDAPF